MQINYLAVVVAAVAGFLLGWGWYMLFGNLWMAGLGKSKEDCKDRKPALLPLIIVAIACLVMAYMLAGLMGHINQVSIRGGAISAFFVWIGFVLTTVASNQAFQGVKPVVTAIDAGHWLAVLLLMGAIIGAFGI
jgi:hypothetical protein